HIRPIWARPRTPQRAGQRGPAAQLPVSLGALTALRDAGLERRTKRLAHGLELDAVEHVLEEAAHDQPLRLGPREAAGHEVEELLPVDLAERRPVRAADVVGEDLEPGDAVRVR